MAQKPLSAKTQAETDQAARALALIASRLHLKTSSIVDTTVDRLRSEIPSYSSTRVPLESLRASVTQHIDTVTECLETRSMPNPVRDTSFGSERAREGLPIEDVLLGIRLTFQSLRASFHREAEEIGAPPMVFAEGLTLLWEVSDVVSREYAISHRGEDLNIARQQEGRRVNFVRNLLLGAVGIAELDLWARAFALSPDREHLAFRARCAETDLETTAKALQAWARSTGNALQLIQMEGDICGITTGLVGLDIDAPVGVGTSCALSDISGSFRVASRALDIGIQFGFSGTITLADLSIRTAIAAEHDLGALLVALYIDPVRNHESFGDIILESVDSYLDADLDTAASARRLQIHPNTLRYRVNRFKEITGTSLASPRELAEVWWAFRRREWERNRDKSDSHRGALAGSAEHNAVELTGGALDAP